VCGSDGRVAGIECFEIFVLRDAGVVKDLFAYAVTIVASDQASGLLRSHSHLIVLFRMLWWLLPLSW
jgi:hypothetical protein